MNDDAFYDEVAREMLDNRLVPGVWARAFAEADGGENRAKAIYIKYRVAQMAKITRRQLEESKWTTRPPNGDENAVSWEVVNKRWVRNIYANGGVTMSDKASGKMWLYNPSLCGNRLWSAAVVYCDNLTYAQYSDWRLPDKDTLEEQFCQKGHFAGVQNYYYWSGTSGTYCPDYAVCLYMGSGVMSHFSKALSYYHYVWPIRGG